MGCLLAVVAVMFPRLALLAMWLVGYGGRAFETALWPLLGFFFLPFTTCAYALAINEVGGVQGAGLAFVIIGVLLDFAGTGGAARRGRGFYYAHYYR